MIIREEEYMKFDSIYKLVKKFDSTPPTPKPNYTDIKVTTLPPTEENANTFNKILIECKKRLRRLKRTESGGISTDCMVIWPSYDYAIASSGAELIVLIPHGFYRIQFRIEIKKQNEKVYSGTNCFYSFIKMCRKCNVDLTKYELTKEEGLEEKEKIPMPLLKMAHEMYVSETEDGKGFEQAHHIDFHHSYPSGLINTHPEFREVFEKIRDELSHDFSKAIMNLTIGYFQSQWCNYKYAGLAKDAIIDNIERVEKLAKELKEAGRTILAYNTDGIWYTGDIFHSTMEGKGFGQCENDHINCKIRFKSIGAYEYIENKKYHPVVRGVTKLDITLPREQWKWGDIYNSEIIKFYLTEDGIIYG